MMSIIMSHFYTHGVNTLREAPFFAFIPQFLAVISNAVFFLISGFFLFKTKFSLKKLILLVIEILFYNYIILLVNVFIYNEKNPVSLIEEVFPITSNMNWFLSVYVFLYAMGPFIRKLCSSLRSTPRLYSVFMLTLFLFYSVLGFITPENVYNVSLMQGFFTFLLGDYLNFNKDVILCHKYKLIGILSFLLAIFITAILQILAGHVSIFSFLTGHVIKGSSPLTIITACSLLLMFSQLSFHSKLINNLASGTLAIYLVHDNNAFRHHIWFDIFSVQNHLTDYFVYSFVTVIAIYSTILLVDICRKKTIEKVFAKLIDSCSRRWQVKLEKLGFPY